MDQRWHAIILDRTVHGRWNLRGCYIIKAIFPGIGIPMIKIGQLWDPFEYFLIIFVSNLRFSITYVRLPILSHITASMKSQTAHLKHLKLLIYTWCFQKLTGWMVEVITVTMLWSKVVCLSTDNNDWWSLSEWDVLYNSAIQQLTCTDWWMMISVWQPSPPSHITSFFVWNQNCQDANDNQQKNSYILVDMVFYHSIILSGI